jgi:hypothetical protein
LYETDVVKPTFEDCVAAIRVLDLRDCEECVIRGESKERDTHISSESRRRRRRRRRRTEYCILNNRKAS